MKKHLFLALATLVATLYCGSAAAHGAATALPPYEGDLSEAIAPPQPGALEFVLALIRHGQSRFTAEQLNDLHDIQVRFREAVAREQAANNEDDRLVAGVARTNAEAQLNRFFAASPVPIPIRFEGTEVEMPVEETLLAGHTTGTLIFRVLAGDGPPHWHVVEEDLSMRVEPDPFTPVPYTPGHVNYVLFVYRDAPPGPAAYHLGFEPEGGGEARTGVLLTRAPYPGTARFEWVNEHGEPTPVMMRLTYLADQTLHRPGNAVNLDPQMKGIAGKPGATATAYEPYGSPEPNKLSGQWGGWYWLVPEPFEMALAPGEWEVQLYHGFEYQPVKERFTVVSNAPTEVRLTLDRWVDMPAKGWYSGDDHVHSRLMSDQDADNLITYARATQTRMVNVLRMGNNERTYFEQRGYGRAYRVVEDGYALVPGQEDPRYFMGHAIGLNLAAPVRDMDRYINNAWIADMIHAGGGLYGHAHVNHAMFDIERDMVMLVPRGKSDFGEIHQVAYLGTELYHLFLNLGYRLTASAGSDASFFATMGEVQVYTYLGEQGFDVDHWFDAFEAGRTFVTNGPMLEFTVDGALPGDVLRFDEDTTLRVKGHAEGRLDGTAPAWLELIHLGEVVASAAGEKGKATLELDVPWEVGFGGWLALRATSHDGSEAHTTPVYIERKGYRPWKHAEVPALLDRCARKLDEIEGQLRDTVHRVETGAIAKYDLYNPMTAAMAPQVFPQIEEVRGILNGLRETWEAERETRGE